MSKAHPYRVQLHCDKQMHNQIKLFSEERGLSDSAAARLLIDRGLSKDDDSLSVQLGEIDRMIKATLHASIVSRLMATEAAEKSGSELSADDIKYRVEKMKKRYNRFEG